MLLRQVGTCQAQRGQAGQVLVLLRQVAGALVAEEEQSLGGAHPITTCTGTLMSCTAIMRLLPSSAATACITLSPFLSLCSSDPESRSLGLLSWYGDSLPLWKCGSSRDAALIRAGSTPATQSTDHLLIGMEF